MRSERKHQAAPRGRERTERAECCGGWDERDEEERIRGWVSGVKCTAHRRGTTPRLVRGRRDRCPWDARAFLVREAHETNGRRASPDHAFPREKKLRCVYPWLAFAFRIRPSLSSPRSPIYGGRGWKGVSQFLPYAASNAGKFLSRG